MSHAHESFEVRQAADRVERRPVLYVVVAALIVAAVALASVRAFLVRGVDLGSSKPPAPVPAGTLESSLVASTARGLELRRAQHRALDAWRILDRDAGIAQIPVETAIDVWLRDPIPATRPFDPDGGPADVAAPSMAPDPPGSPDVATPPTEAAPPGPPDVATPPKEPDPR